MPPHDVAAECRAEQALVGRAGACCQRKRHNCRCRRACACLLRRSHLCLRHPRRDHTPGGELPPSNSGGLCRVRGRDAAPGGPRANAQQARERAGGHRQAPKGLPGPRFLASRRLGCPQIQGQLGSGRSSCGCGGCGRGFPPASVTVPRSVHRSGYRALACGLAAQWRWRASRPHRHGAVQDATLDSRGPGSGPGLGTHTSRRWCLAAGRW
mmetsp:Transcript_15185/g.33721  ORF Transcript_15185/g.33721 Transcript_15185/m.33721 type:complete len:211 (-) Transcript_15185:394-1026(-)